jgi:hypothetical protein
VRDAAQLRLLSIAAMADRTHDKILLEDARTTIQQPRPEFLLL